MTVRTKFIDAEIALNSILYNRIEEVHGLMLAPLAGRKLRGSHTFYLGVPGTAKSYMAKLFASMFDYKGKDGSQSYFEYGFNPFTKVTDIFGPTDISALKNSILKYKSDNYLPNARIAFLDELGRGEKVLDTLLTIINEREYKVDGKTELAPLDMVISASNQKITGSHYEALRDRFLQWFVPAQIDDDDMLEYIMNDKPETLPSFTEAELLQAKIEAQSVVISKEVAELLKEIVMTVRNEKGIVVSDRRIKMIVPLIKAEAWFNGRTEAIARDLLPIWSTLWVEPEQIPTVKEVVSELAVPVIAEINKIKEDSIILVQDWKRDPVKYRTEDVSNKLKKMKKKLGKLVIEPEDKSALDTADLMISKFQTSVANILVAEMHNLNI